MIKLQRIFLSTAFLFGNLFVSSFVVTNGKKRFSREQSFSSACRNTRRFLNAVIQEDEDFKVKLSPTPVLSTAANTSARRVAILFCPAQFCVPDDYQIFFDNLSNWQQQEQQQMSRKTTLDIATSMVAELPRTEWIKVARQLPTRQFFTAQLDVAKTLSWYFQAMDKAVAHIFASEQQQGYSVDEINLCIIGHSMGGWVARAYLGGMSASSTAVQKLAVQRCSSLITLGTPHTSSPTALVDQTRGLLRAIDDTPSCSPQALADQGINITCVCSSGMNGSFLTTDIEKFVAASSYLPLLGHLGQAKKGATDQTAVAYGDGIVPFDLAFLEAPARRVIVESCTLTNAPVRHSHIVPTPWNLINGYAPSIILPPDQYPSYISQGVLPQWAQYIQ